MSGSAYKGSGWSPYLWIIFAALLLYINTASFSFTFFDDDKLILDNQEFLGKPSNILTAFTRKIFDDPDNRTPFYRPLLAASFILDARISGPDPWFYHLTNILIHAAAGCLLFLLLIKLKYAREPSFLLSILFIAHPALTQAVAWIPGRNDSLLTVFALLSFISFLNFAENRGPVWYLLHQLFFAAALFTKESAAALVLLCILYSRVVMRAEKRPGIKALGVGWFCVAALWFYLRTIALAGTSRVNIFELTGSAVFSIPGVIQLFGKMILPFDLSVFPIICDTSSVYGFLAIVLLFLSVRFSRDRSGKMILFGAAWFLLFLLPSTIKLKPFQNGTVEAIWKAFMCNNVFLEHRLYAASIGVALILSEVDLVKHFRARKTSLAIALATILFFAAMTLKHSDNFKNGVNFWMNAARTSPSLSYAHHNFGAACYYAGMTEAAEFEARRAISIDPQVSGANGLLGLMAMEKNNFKEAEILLKKEIVLNPKADSALGWLGLMYVREGRLKEAESVWKKALKLNNGNESAWKNLAIYYYDSKDFYRAGRCVRYLIKRFGTHIPHKVLVDLDIKSRIAIDADFASC